MSVVMDVRGRVESRSPTDVCRVYIGRLQAFSIETSSRLTRPELVTSRVDDREI